MEGLIPLGRGLYLDPKELNFSYVRASGPGGQNVNKVSSAAELRFDLGASPSLPLAVKQRAARLAGRRLNAAGEILIFADRFRDQPRNREDAINRLVELLAEAAIPPTPRRPTRATKGSKERRLSAKKSRSRVKEGRSRPRPD